MKRPANIDKVYGFDLYINDEHYKILECTDDTNLLHPNTTRLWLRPQIRGGTTPMLLMAIHWDLEAYDLKYVEHGRGVSGQHLDAGLISRYDASTMLKFVNFFRTQVKQYVHTLQSNSLDYINV